MSDNIIFPKYIDKNRINCMNGLKNTVCDSCVHVKKDRTVFEGINDDLSADNLINDLGLTAADIPDLEDMV